MMRTSTLLRRNLTHFWRTNLAVVFGVAAAVAVLAGALVVGDSVRASLRDIFLQRLGRTDSVVSAFGFFREELADELRADERFAAAGFDDLCPLVVLAGAVTHEESGRRAANVQVYGVDERFWKFHGRGDGSTATPRAREILASASLAEELKVAAGDVLLLRVEKPSDIPAESLHGRKENLGRTIRLTAREPLDAARLGEFSLRPQQSAVRAVFIPLRLIQQDLEQEGRVNVMLVSARDDGGTSQTATLERVLRERATLEDMGVKLRPLPQQQSISLETESALVNDKLAKTASESVARVGLDTAPVLSYLANSIRAGGREIPYSLVTALDEESFAGLRRAGANPDAAPVSDAGDSLPPIILNEWAAQDLGARLGEMLQLEYYVWENDNRLTTGSAQFRLAGVVPIEGFAADRDLVPSYPGITESESLSDWDPPFPIDLRRVRPKDEDYWKTFRTTPKAFIPLAVGRELWQTRFGGLTSIRINPRPETTAQGEEGLQSSLDSYRGALKTALDPADAGLSVYPVRARGLEAARGATDFGEYFLYFSFFIVASALLLTVLFFRLGVEQRLREIGILRAVGFPPSHIRRIFLAEGFFLALAGSLIGVGGAILYGRLMIHGLKTWWVGAVGTTALTLHVAPRTLALGAAAGVATALLCVLWTLRRLRRASPRSLLAGEALEGQKAKEGQKVKGKRQKWEGGRASSLLPFAFYLLPLFLGVGLLLAAWLGVVGQVAGFFGGGTLLLAGLLAWQAVWLRRGGRNIIQGRGAWPVARLGFRSASYRPGRSVLCIALISAASFIIVAVDAFRRDDSEVKLDRTSGTGGYPILAESVVPLIQDPNTAEGRDALNLATDAKMKAALEGVRLSRFRLRPGDDASCLNLYQPREPRIVAPINDFLEEKRFTFQNSVAETDEEKANPWLLLKKNFSDGAVPVVADVNSLTYVLHLGLGDEFVLEREGAGAVRLRVVGALSDSLFQGEFLMSEENFVRLFPQEEGYRFFLLDTPAEKTSEVAALLEDRLADFGFDAQSTSERLASFHRVENTFLSTFQVLGGLGLVLGTLGLAAVLLRNVLERRRELALLRAVGYNRTHFALMVLAENALLLFCGLLTGTLCALLAVAPIAHARGGQLPILSLAMLLAAVVVSGFLASLVATVAALRAPLIATLRAE